MANAKFDYSNPTVVTITNVAKDVIARDAGTKAKLVEGVTSEKLDVADEIVKTYEKDSVTHYDVMRKVIPCARRIQFWKTNSYAVLENTGDDIKIAVKYSAELAYYMSLANEDIKVEQAAPASDSTPETPKV